MQEWQNVNIDNISLEDADEMDLPLQDLDSTINVEMFIFSIKNRDLVKILLLRALGLSHKEIIKIININNNVYYSLLNELKKEFIAFMDY
jgi:hypothetical protein